MFYRVEVHVIHVRPVVGVVTNKVLPIPPLPDATLAASQACRRQSLGFRQCFGKIHFNQPPAGCEIGIARWQFNHAMQMLRQDHPAMNVEWVTMANRTHHFPQQRNMPCQQIVAMPLQQIQREEIGAARMPRTTVIGHADSIAAACIRRNALRLLRPTSSIRKLPTVTS